MTTPCDTLRSPLATLAHTNSSGSDATANDVTGGGLKRRRVLQSKTSPPPASGLGFRVQSERRSSGEALRSCEIAAAATLVQSHARRQHAQRVAAAQRRVVFRRRQIVREIHKSELSYNSSLRVLDQHYMQQVMWKGAQSVTALPRVAAAAASPAAAAAEVAAEVADSPVAASPMKAAAAPGTPKGTPIAMSPVGTPGSARKRSGMRRRGSVDSNLGGLTAKLAARAASSAADSQLAFPSAEEVDTMFCGGALLSLIDLSKQLTTSLDAVANGDVAGCCGAATQVGEIFVQLAPRFLIFSDYCKKTEAAMAAVTRCQEQYPTFGQYMTHLQSVPASPAAAGGDGAGGTLDLLSYLIMPVQRVPRYVMLLTELLDTIPADDEASRAVIAKALEVVRESAIAIDSAVGVEQRRIRLQQIMGSLRDVPAEFDVAAAGRTLLREGRLQLSEAEDATAPETSQLNASIASIGSHFGIGTPKKDLALTPSRMSLGGTPKATPNRTPTQRTRRMSMLRRKSVCIEPDRRCCGNHLAVLCNDVLLITKPFEGEFGHERLRWVDCVWLNGSSVEENARHETLDDEFGFSVGKAAASTDNAVDEESAAAEEEEEEEEDNVGSSRHMLVAMDAASKAEWVIDLEAAIEVAPEPPLAIEPISPEATPDRLGATIGTPIELPSRVEVSPAPTTPVRALKGALLRGKRASGASARKVRRSSLRRKSTTDAPADAAAAAAAQVDEFRVSDDGSLLGNALPESDADAAALRDAMHEQLHALISLDMQKFLLESECKGSLREWANVSDWAHDTGGGEEERRAERGIWLRLFAAVQKDLAPQFGIDPDAIEPPNLDTPMCSPAPADAGEISVKFDCSPVMEANELPVLNFTSPGGDNEADEESALGGGGGLGLTLNLPPLASTPLSTRPSKFARPSGGSCCNAPATSPTASKAIAGIETPAEEEQKQGEEEMTASLEAPTTEELTAAVSAAVGAAAVVVTSSPSASSDSASSPARSPASPGGKPPQRRKRRTSSFACCAAPVSP